MGVRDIARTVIVGSIMLLVIASVLGDLDPSLSSELNNTAAHPNGPLTLAIIGFFVLAVAVELLLRIFDQGKESVRDLRIRE